MWNWLTDQATLNALGAIGGAISFLWGVGWAIYQHKAGQPVSARRGSAPERRPVSLLAMLGTVLAIWATVLIMAGTTWWLWKTYIVEKLPVVSYVCRSENGDRCPAGSTVVGCGDAGPVMQQVEKSCSKFEVRQIMNTSGGQCGHSAWEMKCSPK